MPSYSVGCLRTQGALHLSARRGRRCLTLQPPSPEDKLATLSDIAQEYSVEWDAHAAASEMLPPSGAQPLPYGGGGPLVRWGACRGAACAVGDHMASGCRPFRQGVRAGLLYSTTLRES